MDRLLQGYREFRTDRWPAERARYEELADKGQKPEYLIIACSDSRSDPTTIFNARPGEFFVIRNVAAIVPPYEPYDDTHHGTSAAIAFAVLGLNVRNVLVMGHAQCGGVAAALDPNLAAGIPFLQEWIQLLDPAWADSLNLTDSHARHEAMERDCVRLSLQRLLSFPFVEERVRAGALALHGARFGIADGKLEILDQKTDTFVTVD
ncbi:MAG TPA: carbonic anhydrase [Rhizomicrobium sp.]|jgi:carbonic anhydrase